LAGVDGVDDIEGVVGGDVIIAVDVEEGLRVVGVVGDWPTAVRGVEIIGKLDLEFWPAEHFAQNDAVAHRFW
jgi:predicted ABC-type sugar transport system permease subunit